jgi:uncharacterized protein (DUF1778 family)
LTLLKRNTARGSSRKPEERGLIDWAATLIGKTCAEFMLEARGRP